ncbi:PREDICTED: carbohydrate sulfotransferase 13-like, partial [Dipodomys ordii]|uniref:Carbohydrate sulfotransferase n=1 Tax=Dipodomys ordii TaxID=10020 RepID=A0A1S3GWV1_DIPOR
PAPLTPPPRPLWSAGPAPLTPPPRPLSSAGPAPLTPPPRCGPQAPRRSRPLPARCRPQAPRSALAEVHRQRRDLLRQACSRHSRRPRALRPEELRHVLVDDAHGLLYCYVPKVACTNWKRVLLALRARAHGDTRDDPRAIPAREAHAPGRLPSLADFRPSNIHRRLLNYLTFLYVHDPFQRLLSAYFRKFARRCI